MAWQYSLEGVLMRLKTGRFAAVIAEVAGDVKAVCIVETLVYDRCRCLSLVALAGEGEGHWPQWLEMISQYAREAGCRYIVTYGARVGWSRVVKEMRALGNVMILDLVTKEMN